MQNQTPTRLIFALALLATVSAGCNAKSPRKPEASASVSATDHKDASTEQPAAPVASPSEDIPGQEQELTASVVEEDKNADSPNVDVRSTSQAGAVSDALPPPRRIDNPRTAQVDTAMLLSHYGVGPTIATAENPTSTFAVDVDTASYAVLRAHLDANTLPDPAAVRVEEVINYFDYHYAAPEADDFSLHAEVVPSPQRTGYHVLHIGLKGKEVGTDARPAANLVFVVDVSGSMRGHRLETVKKSLALLVDQLRSDDSVGIVAYGSGARVVLEPTAGSDTKTIRTAIDTLRTRGSTNLELGLTKGYALIGKAKMGAGINRVILCSDGIANTGATTADAILASVAEQAERGVTISTVGVGMGGYNDTLMEQLADKGNGNYAYVDDLAEAKRVFVDHVTGTLQVVAKDVKIQLEFDDEVVSRYRLLGYENRGLSKREFDDDDKDAGEIGAGHTVTALYEIKIEDEEAERLGTLRVRYKKPRGTRSELLERPLPTSLIRKSYGEAAPPTRLSMVAAAYAEKLRDSYWVRNLSWQQVQTMYAQIDPSLKEDPAVVELGRLIDVAATLDLRGDRFQVSAPIARMDFDRVPVLR